MSGIKKELINKVQNQIKELEELKDFELRQILGGIETGPSEEQIESLAPELIAVVVLC